MRDKPTGTATIVCVHGAGGGGWEWGVWARMFNLHGFDVIAPDLMPAAAGLAATRFADYREQVVAWCRAGSVAPILIGASLGGLLALTAASEVNAAALVLLNPMPPRGIAGASTRRRPAIVPWASERSLAATRRALADADDAARMYAYRRWRDESGAVLNEACDGIEIETPSCPILVLASADDEDVAAATSRALAGRLGADFERIAQASHVGPLLGRVAARSAERVCNWLIAQPIVAI
jgi:pimeloyl-ACP methyl ester carboxylesterase